MLLAWYMCFTPVYVHVTLLLCSFVDNVFKPSDAVLEKAKEWYVVGRSCVNGYVVLV